MIKLSPKFKLHRTRIDFTPPFSATRAFSKSGKYRQSFKNVDNVCCSVVIYGETYLYEDTNLQKCPWNKDQRQV